VSKYNIIQWEDTIAHFVKKNAEVMQAAILAALLTAMEMETILCVIPAWKILHLVSSAKRIPVQIVHE